MVKKRTVEDFTPLKLPSIPTLSNLRIYVPEEALIVNKLPAYFCVPEGEVHGWLTITHHVVMFNPEAVDQHFCSVFNGEKKEKLPASRFQALVDCFDVEDCETFQHESWLEKPGELERTLVFLRLILKRAGGETREDASPALIFRLSALSDAHFPLSRSELEQKASDCCGLISTAASGSYPPSHTSLTQLPYVEWLRPRISTRLSSLSISLLKFADSFELYAEDEVDYEEFVTTDIDATPTPVPSLTTMHFPIAPLPPAPFELNGFTSEILNRERYEVLVFNLPALLQLRQWELVFSLPTHGASFSTFFQQSALCGNSILLIEDQRKHAFGGYAPETWRVRKLYYGTGEAFLFSFHDTDDIKCYWATGANDYYMMSDYESLAMGAG
jgi:hypothetical protein